MRTEYAKTLDEIYDAIDGAHKQAAELESKMNERQKRAWTKLVVNPVTEALAGIDKLKGRIEALENGSQ